MNKDKIEKIKELVEEKQFEKIVRLDNNGKFINKDTKIELIENGEYLLITNFYSDGVTQSIKVKLKNKK